MTEIKWRFKKKGNILGQTDKKTVQKLLSTKQVLYAWKKSKIIIVFTSMRSQNNLF